MTDDLPSDRQSAEPADDVHRVEYDIRDGEPLSTAVVLAVAEAADIEPADIQEPLYNVLDPDALNSLFGPKADGTPRDNGKLSFSIYGHDVTIEGNESIHVQSSLARLNREGGNVLVVGRVPDELIDAASVDLLGDATMGREHVFALLDRNVATATERLSASGASPTDAQVINYHAEARSAAVQTDISESAPEITNVTDNLDELQEVIMGTFTSIDRENDGLEPAELRFAFDSLRPIIDEREYKEVEAFLEPLCTAIQDVSGVGHFILPAEHDSAHVQAIKSLFDIVVELRVGDSGSEQRWHLPEMDYASQWFPMRN